MEGFIIRGGEEEYIGKPLSCRWLENSSVACAVNDYDTENGSLYVPWLLFVTDTNTGW